MALQKTNLLNITSISGINTVGILTVGVTPTAGGVGVASTTFVRSVIMHNTGLGTARASLYINDYPTTTPNALGYGVTEQRILRVDLAPNETTFFETNYPIVLAPYNAIAVDVIEPDAGGSGIGSMINVVVNGDTES